jgi:hypothetical protein
MNLSRPALSINLLAAVFWMVTSDRVLAVDFERDVAPILEARCVSCHAGDAAKGDVRLDRFIDASDWISAGDPDSSVLLQQVTGPEPAMPKLGKPLTDDQVETLRQWIAEGATWPDDRVLRDQPDRDLDWWSLKPIVAATTPASTDTVATPSTVHPVDAFINHSLSAKGLKRTPPADPQILVRRLVYDLTGLPPTEEQIHHLDRLGYESLVDALLDSPEFGEKWARHWLDLVRYAETHGYDKDQPRPNAWPYRDYVIRAFNDDKPYDRFVQEQIAGDALFPGDPNGVIALGFLAAGPWDLIGHIEVGEQKIDGRIAKHLDRDEMISAIYNVFVSTTVQCAQCHHHKFDPVLTEDYYRLHAIFAAVDRADRAYQGLSPDQQADRDRWLARADSLRGQRDRIEREIAMAVAASATGIDNRMAELKQAFPTDQHPRFGWHSEISTDQNAAKWVQIDLGDTHEVESVRLVPAYDTFAGIGAGFGFPVRFRVESSTDADFSTGIRLHHDDTGSDGQNPGYGDWEIAVGGEAIRAIRVTATRLAPRSDDFIFALGEIEVIGSERRENLAADAAVSSLDSIEMEPRWGRANLTDGIYYRELSDPQALDEWIELRDRRAVIEAEYRTPEVIESLAAFTRELADLEAKIAGLPEGPMVYSAATRFDPKGQFVSTGGTPRPIRLLHRGDITSPGDEMRPGMPPLWPGAEVEFGSPAARQDGDQSKAQEADARATLAQSITRHDNPLFWRSVANRVWQWTFGKPLVGTPNDFGRMGMEPTHPELLDYLAARLRDDPNRSLKSMIRLLVTSDAYRRSSGHDEANVASDAENAFLWRADRRRLTAEEFRDSVLSVAGKLRKDERGGPGFQDFIVEKPEHSPHYQYHLHDPSDPASHRRSIYRFVVRSQPHPFLTALDCADPSLSVASRDESTTALQALTQWNHRMIEVMSRALADRITGQSDPVDAACRLALGRPPEPIEREVLGEHLRDHGPASLARVIFNMNAFVYLD